VGKAECEARRMGAKPFNEVVAGSAAIRQKLDGYTEQRL